MNYQIKRHPRRRRLSLHIERTGAVIVRAPQLVSQKQIDSFVNQHAVWVSTQLQKLQYHIQAKDNFSNGSQHWYLGQPCRLEIVEKAHKDAVLIEDDMIRISVCDAYTSRMGKDVLNRWYQKQAKKVFSTCFNQQYQRVKDLLDLPPVNKLSIRSMKTRWGSCSSNCNISLNLHLIHFPLSCLEYIIVHELCHLKEMNHSHRFHALMDQALPDWPERKKELKKSIKTISWNEF